MENDMQPNNTSPVDSTNESINQNQIDNSPLPTDSEEQDIATNTKVGSKRKKSDVWQHFTKVGDKAQCSFCKKYFCGKSSDGTSHLRGHLLRCTQRSFRDIRQQVLMTEHNKKDGKTSITNYQFDQDRSRKELARMIILHEYPLSIVDHHGFRMYTKSLQPLFIVPSRNTIKSDIFDIYDFEKNKTMKILKENTSKIAMTTDMWTSNNQKKGFMVITAHFIDNDWRMQSKVMRFIYVPSPHTCDVLSHVFLESVLDWNLDRKLSTLTVDNCTTNDAMIRTLLEKLPSSSLILQGKLLHMRCCAHILNIIVQAGLSVISHGIEKVRESVAFWIASPKRVQKFEEASRQLDMDSTKKLSLDCKTRWNSTYLMLRVALTYKDVFERLAFREQLFKCCPIDDEWDIAKEVCDKLQVFYIVTEKFSGTKYPTANLFFPEFCRMRVALYSWNTSSCALIKSMATDMITKFEKYWAVIHGVMSVAAILDPRFKMKLLEFYFPQIYEEKSTLELEKVKTLCHSLLEEYQSRESPKASNEGCSSSMLSSAISSATYDDLAAFDSFLMCSQSWLWNEVNETCSLEMDAHCQTIGFEEEIEDTIVAENNLPT